LYVGKGLGRNKLAPSISPNKTWEGAIASLVLGAGAGLAYLLYFEVSTLHWAVLAGAAALMNVAGQTGDLAESVLKRGAHIKDSGALLPGHGGMLDRMDGALFSYPALYVFLEVLRRLA
jgi:phosphatidate cytidylyltransferase